MKTRLTSLLGIRYPILLSGMSFISTPELVAAVSNAGGLGILATGPLDAGQTRTTIGTIRRLTDKPFGGNVTLAFPGAEENARILIEERVPVINFALGKGDWIVRETHAYGGKAVATVTNARHALRAQGFGADAVIATGNEAAAHGEPVTSLVLIPSLVDVLHIPVAAAGGFADGRGLAAALALGAEGIAMGSRFSATVESPLHPLAKKAILDKAASETLYSARFDGMPGRAMDSPGARRAMARRFNPLEAFAGSLEAARLIKQPYHRLFLDVLRSGVRNAVQMACLAMGFRGYRFAIEEGNLDRGFLPIGQVTGLIHDEPTVAELIGRIVVEARAVQCRISRILDDGTPQTECRETDKGE